jgi:hypothetical protein
MLGGSSPAPSADTSRVQRATASCPGAPLPPVADDRASRSWTAWRCCVSARRSRSYRHAPQQWGGPPGSSAALCSLGRAVSHNPTHLRCCARCIATLSLHLAAVLMCIRLHADVCTHLVVNFQHCHRERPRAVRFLGGNAEQLLGGLMLQVQGDPGTQD